MVEEKNGALVVTRETKGPYRVYSYKLYATIIIVFTSVSTLSSLFISPQVRLGRGRRK